ncbi:MULTISPECIES: 30S ribosomal protein S18 [Mycoplasmatota]|uniref:Small ribosomal subunit protein bS18 n=1 Tax=Mesomycoplasma hyorhinis TaxID=2100 RepID=A0AAJ3D6T9_MESHY|nr:MULTISPECIES: 30S ribosomal protein S18 [Mycoplasmatota]ADM21982.1 30S ribosomal protein S18 [Mesomycoplasma hyorhinis HUB-1]MXR06302.1 30S ribosomal protein S18 [Mesomycoplasma hyorhinis]MXR07031.1 30S ribosomal protein S18 [Mesomycoplasma hyorhinis]MXR07791.1 30S ribosomal protein S18 [Mesomycoplasma hyorhinis]MXR08600.1 30S ribosomal protein S18 [Mesomycoplasma hyorhinis]
MNKKNKKKLKKKPCHFCETQTVYIDYKNVEVLEKFVNPHGKIQPSRITGSCSKHQRQVSLAIKRARMIALMAFVGERVRR